MLKQLLIILVFFTGCKDQEFQSREFHEETVYALCDTGLDCARGVVVEHYADYAERLTVEGYTPMDAIVCSLDVRQGGGGYELYTEYCYTENIPGYFYFYSDVPANTKLYLYITLSVYDLPAEGDLLNFGDWITHFDQYEFPTHWNVYATCP